MYQKVVVVVQQAGHLDRKGEEVAQEEGVEGEEEEPLLLVGIREVV